MNLFDPSRALFFPTLRMLLISVDAERWVVSHILLKDIQNRNTSLPTSSIRAILVEILFYAFI
jgi:hypothetical protein